MHVTRLLSIAAFICTASCGAANTTEADGSTGSPDLDDSTELFFEVSGENGDMEESGPRTPMTSCSLMSPELSYAIIEVTDITSAKFCGTDAKYSTSTFVNVRVLAPIYNTDTVPKQFDLYLANVGLPDVGQKVLYGFVEHDGDYLSSRSIFLDTKPSTDRSRSYVSPDNAEFVDLPPSVGELKQAFEELSQTQKRSCSPDEIRRSPTADLAIYPFTRSTECPKLVENEVPDDPNGLHPPGD